MSRQSDVLIIIPAYNEEDAIEQTVDHLRKHVEYDYLIVDDGSKDRTAAIIRERGYNGVRLPVNLGIGGAMQTGYRYAARHGYKYAIQLDADGQHDARDIDKLVREIRESGADMVIGSRFVEKSSYKSSLPRRIGIYYFYMLIRLLTGNRIFDPTSGYRIVNSKIIGEFATYYPVDYPEVEILVSMARSKYRIKEISVEMKKRQGGVSSINPIRSVYYMLKVTMFSIIRRSF
ncbi:glycosyltransferase family 2 protein [Paenibacillus sp. UNC499MF]|uniref:glycosyltransferase family 2 protein n=1 Tax=Paenibacillus sp. UNC499MF TaxID=1502751 RepID=UPI00089F8E3F|nr:glycosyltransferase family 2 protein [Paenibacillus sp. UNC499MF]SEG74477.1 Glycosyl transferase family 2 [Paenibacillus sp. UNC499MF]